MAQTAKSVAAEGALEDLSVLGAIEKRAPLLEFVNARGRFLRVKLGHAPVVQHFSAAHGVAEVGAPVVGRVDIGHGGGDAAFRHHGVGFAEEGFADDADGGALSESFDGGAKARATGADDEHVMFVGFEFIAQKSLTSRMAPEERSRI